jgi:hypothetical protein
MNENENLLSEFSVEELESRLEMDAAGKWIEIRGCDDPSHCHEWNQ